MSVQDKLETLIDPIVESFGCQLWGVEYRPLKNSALLRVFIDKEGGVSLDDCADISYQLSGMLDVEDPIQLAYTLEVSSPGIDRPLLKPEHFQTYVGESVKIRLQWPVDGARNFRGQIQSADEAKIKLEQDGEVVELPYAAITKARLIGDVSFSDKG